MMLSCFAFFNLNFFFFFIAAPPQDLGLYSGVPWEVNLPRPCLNTHCYNVSCQPNDFMLDLKEFLKPKKLVKPDTALEHCIPRHQTASYITERER